MCVCVTYILLYTFVILLVYFDNSNLDFLAKGRFWFKVVNQEFEIGISGDVELDCRKTSLCDI